jgi:Flp pilus assembly protein TadD
VAVASNLMAAGDDQRAEGILTQMLEADPAHRPALEALGRLYMARQRFDEAVKVHNRLVVLYAPDPRVHNALGVSLLMAGQVEGALIHLTRSMELDPTNVRFITNLAKALMMKGSWGLAQELLEKAFVLSEGRQMEAILEALDYCNERSREQLQAGAA